VRFLDHSQTHTTVGRTPLDGLSARRSDLYLKTHESYNGQTSIPPAGFEPAIPASERPQTHTSHRAATGTGIRYTYLLIPWCRVLLEKLTGLQLVKKFPAFHGTRRFITARTSVRHLSLSWASPIQSIYPHPTSWRSIIILSTHLRLGLPILFHTIGDLTYQSPSYLYKIPFFFFCTQFH